VSVKPAVVATRFETNDSSRTQRSAPYRVGENLARLSRLDMAVR